MINNRKRINQAQVLPQLCTKPLIKYVFQPHGDDRGQLVALEEFKDIPLWLIHNLMNITKLKIGQI